MVYGVYMAYGANVVYGVNVMYVNANFTADVLYMSVRSHDISKTHCTIFCYGKNTMSLCPAKRGEWLDGE